MLAAVDFGVFPPLLLDFLAEEIPTLEVTGAELALFVLFISSAHARHAPLHLGAVAERSDQLRHRHWLVVYSGHDIGIQLPRRRNRFRIDRGLLDGLSDCCRGRWR